MSVLTLIAAGLITYVSRVAAFALLPPIRGRLADLVQRLPAPLFAALAALSLSDIEGGFVNPPILVAMGCALISTRWSSLLITLASGLGGYLVASLIW
ncbi:MAG: hypothetical protein GEU79_04990 [Acidimicrobiia bacterium]|nr:hypothetical protein [Acidimicrobiia bacterium]